MAGISLAATGKDNKKAVEILKKGLMHSELKEAKTPTLSRTGLHLV